jgi:hypothetical protein
MQLPQCEAGQLGRGAGHMKNQCSTKEIEFDYASKNKHNQTMCSLHRWPVCAGLAP